MYFLIDDRSAFNIAVIFDGVLAGLAAVLDSSAKGLHRSACSPSVHGAKKNNEELEQTSIYVYEHKCGEWIYISHHKYMCTHL